MQIIVGIIIGALVALFFTTEFLEVFDSSGDRLERRAMFESIESRLAAIERCACVEKKNDK